MNTNIHGIHHVTAITSDAQRNIDFYTGVLGLRLVKLTVNFDDPNSYHLYYGDELGRPGTIMTFFSWPGAPRSRVGPPQVTSTAFVVPAGALDYWSARLAPYDVRPAHRMGDRAVHFADPDGIGLDIVAVDQPEGQPWSGGGIPTQHAIRGFHGVTLSEERHEPTAAVLTELMGFRLATSEGNRFRYMAGDEGMARVVDILRVPGTRRGGMGAGVVHHVAFRTPDDSQQGLVRKRLLQSGMNVSPVMDRNYFHSIYYREPGGVLIEVATDQPGFAVDEPAEHLGTSLMLPPQYEPHRREIERIVPKVRLPRAAAQIPR